MAKDSAQEYQSTDAEEDAHEHPTSDSGNITCRPSRRQRAKQHPKASGNKNSYAKVTDPRSLPGDDSISTSGKSSLEEFIERQLPAYQSSDKNQVSEDSMASCPNNPVQDDGIQHDYLSDTDPVLPPGFGGNALPAAVQPPREQFYRPRQRGAIPSEHSHGQFVPQEQFYRPRQRGAIYNDHYCGPPSTHNQFFRHRQRGPFPNDQMNIIGPTESSRSLHAWGLESSSRRFTKQLHQTKTMIYNMFNKLETEIKCHERIYFEIKDNLDKNLSDVRALKTAALKEKEEAESSRRIALEEAGKVVKQFDKIRKTRDGLEHISTDLSVQLAELNRFQEQLDEQQRILEVLTQFKAEQSGDSNAEERDFMDKKLKDCETKISIMEKELASSRLTSEKLEKNALEQMSDLDTGLSIVAERFMGFEETLQGFPGTCYESQSKDLNPGTTDTNNSFTMDIQQDQHIGKRKKMKTT